MVTEKSLASDYYNEEYYSKGFGPVPYGRTEPWLSFFGNIAQRIKEDFAPRSLLDAGCAIGLLVEQLRLRQVAAEGFDISEYAISQVPAPYSDYCFCRSLVQPFDSHYHLITCIETLEHMAADEAVIAVRNMCQSTDIILFSSTSDDFDEPSHINVQPQEYWINLFRENNFVWDQSYNAAYICPWAKLFRRVPDC